MDTIIRKAIKTGCIAFAVLLVMGGLFIIQNALAQHPAMKAMKDTKKEKASAELSEKEVPRGPRDEYNRGNPRSTIEGFIAATRDGKYELAAHYFFRYISYPFSWFIVNKTNISANSLTVIGFVIGIFSAVFFSVPLRARCQGCDIVNRVIFRSHPVEDRILAHSGRTGDDDEQRWLLAVEWICYLGLLHRLRLTK